MTGIFVEAAGGNRASKGFTALVGARFVGLGAERSLTGTHADSSGSRNKSRVDPLAGAQLDAALPDRRWFDLHGHIGGFDAGPKPARKGCADVGVRASDPVSAYVGHRAPDTDSRAVTGQRSSRTTS